ncbi:putative oxidoreductase [Pseudooceanicola batsensis HTCC2597]|uniref:Putative oxidoreductase n=1 Tax=Pseudooceanicola batsensis (strain ATCC BAA-863 / DSM 15984 / KCTC 12145 / HTCC2597) TaxID=252305 RepID=A3U0G5_PSEBH|nr:Gfo/Idh/MocA family oxidoreductase [Pseudooceanicola batsensis]EAQ02256.1 putative oxidoreductase [Pseudooceanicola batsensis HTCC2597]
MRDDVTLSRPTLGFLGLGWIGRNRMEAMAATGMGEILAFADLDPEAVAQSGTIASLAQRGRSLDEILELKPDGVVIATPSALHAAQTIQAFESGAAVFCQKPLGRNAEETAAAVAAARQADRLLATDLSYRHTAAVRAIADEIRNGGLGEIYAVDLTFHNAYGPDKPWFRDRSLSGGGCLIDLGVHLVDLALWLLDWPEVECRAASLKRGGQPLEPDGDGVEDLALATLETETGIPVRLACSWNLPAGCDAVIRCEFYGTKGGVTVTNTGGSFYDFEAWRHDGCETRLLAAPPDDWGARAAVDWLGRLARGEGYDPECERLVTVARTLDAIYASGTGASGTGRAGRR